MRGGRALRVELEGGPKHIPSRDALLDILGWEGGQFEFTSQEVTGVDEVRSGIPGLVLEHARNKDETER
jgi:hypothetical protein